MKYREVHIMPLEFSSEIKWNSLVIHESSPFSQTIQKNQLEPEDNETGITLQKTFSVQSFKIS